MKTYANRIGKGAAPISSDRQHGVRSTTRSVDTPSTRALNDLHERANRSDRVEQLATRHRLAVNGPHARQTDGHRKRLNGRSTPTVGVGLMTVAQRRPGTTGAVIQRDYDNENWSEADIVRNVRSTSSGAAVFGAALETASRLGLKLKVLPDDQSDVGFTAINQGLLLCVIPGTVSEGEATQILVQELHNAAVKDSLDAAGSRDTARRTARTDYVQNIESLEFPGARASHIVFKQAAAQQAEWTKGGAPRWKAEEVKDQGAYLNHLQETGASGAYEARWQKHNQ